jgi:uncharacterized membrane protein (UPF0127 family)
VGELRVSNPARGLVLAQRARVADTAWSRAVGLLGARDAGGGLLIEPCSSIHTCFMRFPIDVLFLDHADVVLAVYAHLAAWRFTRWVRGARRVLELDAGAAGATAVGDRLECEPCAS